MFPRARITHGIGALTFVAIWLAVTDSMALPLRIAVAAAIVVAGTAGTVSSEIRCFGMFRHLEEAVGAQMTLLSIAHPSSRLHWEITRLACWLTWRDLRLDRGDDSRPVPP